MGTSHFNVFTINILEVILSVIFIFPDFPLVFSFQHLLHIVIAHSTHVSGLLLQDHTNIGDTIMKSCRIELWFWLGLVDVRQFLI